MSVRAVDHTPVPLLLVSIIILLQLACHSSFAHAAHSSTQRHLFPSLPFLSTADMDGDGVDDWIVRDGPDIFVTAADYLAVGKAYGRDPFTDSNENKERDGSGEDATKVVTGSFLGSDEPTLLCIAHTKLRGVGGIIISCAMLQTHQYRLQWLIINQPMSIKPAASGEDEGNVELMSGDFDGDGKDELLMYHPSSGTFQSFVLRSLRGDPASAPASNASNSSSSLSSSQFEFVPGASLSFSRSSSSANSGLRSISASSLSGQQVYIGRGWFDCTCAAASSSLESTQQQQEQQQRQCRASLRSNLTNTLIHHLPPEQTWSEPPMPRQTPNLAAAPVRSYKLNEDRRDHIFRSRDHLLLHDPSTGIVQLFASCPSSAPSQSISFIHQLTSRRNFIPRGGWSLAVANVHGDSHQDSLVLFDPNRGRTKFFDVVSGPNGGDGANNGVVRSKRFWMDRGEYGAIIDRLIMNRTTTIGVGQAARPLEMAFMRIHKPRIIQPDHQKHLTPSYVVDLADDSDSSASTDIVLPISSSAAISSFLRSDLVLYDPTTDLMHAFAATYVTTLPADRMRRMEVLAGSSPPIALQGHDAHAHASRPSSASGAKVRGARVNLPHYPAHLAVTIDAASKFLDATSPLTVESTMVAPWYGQRTFLLAYTQHALRLDSDPDGDGILTRHELGGLDLNMDGLGDEPLPAWGCSPFRKDVLVEVDWMEDAHKSMKPLPGFEEAAIQELAEHNIALHVILDEDETRADLKSRIPRITHLGGDSFDWSRDFDPLKSEYFTPTRRGLFHYCVFIDNIGQTSNSGESRTVPGSDFVISLGSWEGGHGSLAQQSGTFLHELGHNLNLLHGGSDEVNWKPNHLSVMNYQFQMSGVMRDGTKRFMLSPMRCSDLNEKALGEQTGVPCVIDEPFTSHSYSTLVSGTWHQVNTAIDFNQDGRIESDDERVSCDLNGGKLEVLKGSPNEYQRMRFNGIGTPPKTKEPQAKDPARGAERRRQQSELNYEQYQRIYAASIFDSIPTLFSAALTWLLQFPSTL